MITRGTILAPLMALLALEAGCTAGPSGDTTVVALPPPAADAAAGVEPSARRRTVGPRVVGERCTIADGRAVCSGDNAYGQLGANSPVLTSHEAVEVVGVSDVVMVHSGHAHACALSLEGRVYCWGDNRNGQTGQDVVHTPAARRLVRAREVKGIGDAEQLALDDDLSCALRADGALYCWGALHALGLFPNSTLSTKPVAIERLGKLAWIALGDGIGCAITTEQRVRCFGLGGYKQLSGRSRGSLIDGVEGAIGVACGRDHACAVLTDGRVSCWGNNSHGQLGPRALEPHLPAEPVGSLRNVRRLELSSRRSCAITNNQQRWCWGGEPGASGHVGEPRRMPRRDPAPAQGP